MAIPIRWPGKSGQFYTFEAHPMGTVFNPVSAVYIACREVSPGCWQALYVGETRSLYDRINSGLGTHDGLRRAKATGATHIATLLAQGDSRRLGIETDLRHSLDPICNRQSNPGSKVGAWFDV